MSNPRSTRLLTLTLGVGLLAPACGSGPPGDPILLGVMELGAHQLDFGVGQVGEVFTLSTSVRNIGSKSMELALVPGTTTSAAFTGRVEHTWLPPNGETELTVIFAPTEAGEHLAQIVIRSGDANAEAQVLDLRGLAANITLTVEPDHLSFGNVVANTTKTLSLTVSNDTDVDVWIQLADGDNVTRCSAGAGDSAFCVILTDGGLGPDGRFSLGARASTTIDVRFSPLIAGLHDRGQFTLRACASSACEVQVQLEGLAVASGLRCEPATLDFGQVTPGACLTRSATCENVANVPVTVMGWGPSLGASAGTSLDFAFEASSVTVVDEGDALEIYVTYCPDDVGDDAGNLQVETDQDQPSRYVFVGLRGAGG